MDICICGGGNLGHVVAGKLSLNAGNRVSLLTRKPEKWSSGLEIINPQGKKDYGKLFAISDNPNEVVTNADIVIVCLPGFAIHNELEKIKPFIRAGRNIVGSIVSSTGFFFEAHKILAKEIPLFGFQRVPYISRIVEYGKIAEMKGCKSSISMVVEHLDDKENFRQEIEKLFQIPVKLLNNYYEVSLSNSNPLLHPARLYTMWKNWHSGIAYDSVSQFYTDWTDDASSLYIQMDNELQSLLSLLPVRKGCIPPVLEYYESCDVHSLTSKISHIPAFKGILAPMLQTEIGYVPDVKSRYFTEDFPFGMRFIIEIAEKLNFSVPTILEVYKWGTNLMNYPYRISSMQR